ncbi:hypothetical protein [Pelomonas sp. SE-A7]|uniref:hypothetical protein n=1 Tax=Pelomonas sp. SE-A7 TaxID=3054953 RepID=UPI00259C7171|nr:hypothetical protein [Pelomonas sp. SE-A7]MDM4765218.1 hypothetical protein [Pelomonas sp. SE-A7]
MKLRVLPSALCLALGLSLAAARAQTEPQAQPKVVALIATLGDQLTIVRKRPTRISNVEPYSRKALQVDGQLLNYSVLRGLDAAVAAAEPEARRVMLRWRPSEELTAQLKNASIKNADELLLAALVGQLAQMPQRAEWERIEAIVPSYAYVEKDGMPRRIGGIGIFIQPLGSQWDITDEEGVDRTGEYKADDYDTVNPKTGVKGKDSSFVAPYIYFDRLTLDAKTLAVLARKPHYANTKYSDPKSTSMDVMDGLSPADLVSHLSSLVEKAAYQAIRGKVEVEVGPVKQLPGK